MAEKRAALLLRKQLKELQKNPVDGFSAGVEDDNIFEWSCVIVGPPDTFYEGGYFNCKLKFPTEYPDQPPEMYFTSEIWHPNVYEDGKVCISILHPPGEDEFGYEKANERWSPIHTVETILVSVISMLSDPNDESPANIDAARQWREDREGFKKKVQRCVRRSQEML
ncbi:Ubiquitin-conjugating enzyme E2 14 [Balamuthia mandrillaris]